MWILLDLVIVALFVFCAIHFKKKGFLNSSKTIVALILTFVLTPILADPVSKFLQNSTPLGKIIEESVGDTVDSAMGMENDEDAEEDTGMPTLLEKIAGTVSDSVSKETATFACKAIAVVLIFLLIKVLVYIAFLILGIFFKFGPLNFVNRTLGMIMGIANAAAIVYVVCAAAVLLAPFYSDTINTILDQTFITKFCYNYNVLFLLF